ncbi:very-long-chain aldehyde decarbonylase CER1-like [Pyrus x bretschneideri]|uniref:very-long-chain aldehyde decarbonylase CER1-like n=1 Tax=Pyrus x bretschneideri TaxID=225117 RepID=UPI00203064BD|nr:very-long-chain aldehyde decarbonylase CER1-like [Pyrus x bretschneideri]
MASMLGILTEWPWKSLGSFKYLIMAPWVIHSTLLFMVNDGKDKDITYFFIFPLMIWRMIHNQIWITLSRHRIANGNGRILDKGLEFDQVDRERNWDNQILFNGTLLYLANRFFPGAQKIPPWRTDGVVSAVLLHAGQVEYLYYWFHRVLHHHYLYSRYHSDHHSSIVTEPITSVIIHPFAEHMVYSLVFSIPMLATVFMGTVSTVSFAGYITYIDFMNNMGHCKLETMRVASKLFSSIGRFRAELHAVGNGFQLPVLGCSYVESLEVTWTRPVSDAWWLEELFYRLGWVKKNVLTSSSCSYLDSSTRGSSWTPFSCPACFDCYLVIGSSFCTSMASTGINDFLFDVFRSCTVHRRMQLGLT